MNNQVILKVNLYQNGIVKCQIRQIDFSNGGRYMQGVKKYRKFILKAYCNSG